MLAPDDVLAWFQRLEIPEHTRTVVGHIRSSGPSRRVGGGKSNVTGRYPSRKMGVTIQFESHRVELAGIYEMEHDVEVLEYFDQPPTIKLDYESPAGKRMGVLHTPDFFVIREKEAGWEEWKTEADLRQLSERNSNRYCTDESGHYRQHSTIITTNLVYDEWPNFLGSRPMVEALLSRLRHYCHTVHIEGPSLRELQG